MKQDSAEANSTATRHARTRHWLETIGIPFTILAALTTVIAFVITLRGKRLEVLVHVVAIERLHPPKNASGLTYDAYFHDKKLQNLWLIDLSISNSGSLAVIGKGPQCNMLDEAVVVGLPSHAEILSRDLVSSDFPHEASIQANRALSIKFDQWRPGEECHYRIYATSNTPEVIGNVGTNERGLANGIVRVQLPGEPTPGASIRPKWLPSDLWVLAQWTTFISSGLLAMVVIAMSVKGQEECAKFRNWKRTSGAAFESYIRGLDVPQSSIDLWSGAPWTYRDQVPPGIIKCPVNVPLAENLKEWMMMLGGFLLVFMLACGALVLSYSLLGL